MSRARDYQRQRLYDWERKRLVPLFLGPEDKAPMRDLEEAQLYVDAVCAELDVRTVRLRYYRSSSTVGVCSGPFSIALSRRYGLKRWVILHELAHALDWRRGSGVVGYDRPWHGPKFVGIYVDLLVRFSKAGRAELEGSLAGARIDGPNTTARKELKR